jgi:hypothetical protein
MASTARYVSGDCRPIAVKCDANYPIEVGDLLFLEPSNNLARPASALVNQGSQALNQGAFHDVFLGVALQKNGLQPNESVPLNSTISHSPANTIECATAGRFLFPCAATTWNPGSLVGPVNNAGNTGLQDQVVGSVANTSLSIGRAAPAADEIGVSLTQVIVQIESTIMGGGAQNAVAGSSSGAV